MDYKKIIELNNRIKTKRENLKMKSGLEKEKLLLQIKLDEIQIKIERNKVE